MAEKRENSVLFSLRELQQIEEDRVTEEQQAKANAEQERVQAEMAVERERLEAEEAVRRAEQERVRAERDAASQQARAEQLRLEEAERRARIEAQADLDRRRLEQEMEVRRAAAMRSRPKALIFASVVLVLVVAGLGAFMWKQRGEQAQQDKVQAEKLAAAQADAKRLTREKAALEAEMGQIQQEMKALDDRLASAQTDAERSAIRRQLERKRDRLKKLRTTGPKVKNANDGTIKVKCDPNDPLGCM